MTPNKIIKINESFTHFSIDSAADLCIGLSVASKNSAILAGLKYNFFYIFFLKKANTLIFMLRE